MKKITALLILSLLIVLPLLIADVVACAESYEGDAAAILSEFLDGFHYNAALQ